MFEKNVVGKILNINENWRILNDRDFIIAEKKNKNSVDFYVVFRIILENKGIYSQIINLSTFLHIH